MDKDIIIEILTNLYSRTLDDNQEDIEFITKWVMKRHCALLGILVDKGLIALDEYNETLASLEEETK